MAFGRALYAKIIFAGTCCSVTAIQNYNGKLEYEFVDIKKPVAGNTTGANNTLVSGEKKKKGSLTRSNVNAIIEGLSSTARKSPNYNGQLEYVFADIKKPVAGLKGSMTSSNYKAIIDGLSSNLHCNGLRIPMNPNITDATKQDRLFSDVYQYGKSLGLTLYASPLGVGTYNKSRDTYVKWVIDFANEWQPEVLAPFNEAALEGEEYIDWAEEIAAGLSYRPVFVGPDKQHVDDTIEYLSQYPQLVDVFDVVNSHNADSDESATTDGWKQMAQIAKGDGIWATENPRDWSDTNDKGEEIGIKAVVETEGPVTGLVLYLAYPNSLNDDGTLNEKGQAIAEGIVGDGSWMSKFNPFKAIESIGNKLRSGR